MRAENNEKGKKDHKRTERNMRRGDDEIERARKEELEGKEGSKEKGEKREKRR